MKSFTACSILLSGSVALASHGAFAAGTCEALVQPGSCVVATALPDNASGFIGGLSGIEGRILASADDGFNPIRSDKLLRIGDRVVLTEGAKATLQIGPFAQDLDAPSILDAAAVGGCGCITVQSGTRTFAQTPGASAGAAAIQSSGAGAAGGAGTGAAAGTAGAGAASAGAGGLLGGTAATLGISTTALAVGGVAVGAVAVGVTVASVSSSSDDEPASP